MRHLDQLALPLRGLGRQHNLTGLDPWNAQRERSEEISPSHPSAGRDDRGRMNAAWHFYCRNGGVGEFTGGIRLRLAERDHGGGCSRTSQGLSSGTVAVRL